MCVDFNCFCEYHYGCNYRYNWEVMLLSLIFWMNHISYHKVCRLQLNYIDFHKVGVPQHGESTNSVVATFQIYGSKWPALPICEGHFTNLRDAYNGQQNFHTVSNNDLSMCATNLFTTDNCILALDQRQLFFKLVNFRVYVHAPHGCTPSFSAGHFMTLMHVWQMNA